MEKKDKITLVCTSLNPNIHLLSKMLFSAFGFDETILHIDSCPYKTAYFTMPSTTVFIPTKKHLEIGEAYNWIIDNYVKTEWVCCFCDDDYFYPEALSKIIEEVHEGIIAGVAHFKFHVSGHMPREDTRGNIYRRLTGKTEYDLCEKHPITPKLLSRHGRLPAGSFFRKRAWEMVGGFQGERCHDWDLWKRMAQKGIEFKYFDHLVYNHVRRPNSAWERQNS